MKQAQDLYIEEEWVNETDGYRCGNSGIYETFTNNLGRLFKSLQREYGRCQSKVYVDTLSGVREVGWVFQKMMKYEDCNKYYLQSTWITLYNQDKTYHYLDNPAHLQIVKRLAQLGV